MLIKVFNLEKFCIVKVDLDRLNIFFYKEKRKVVFLGVDSYDLILYFIVKDLMIKFVDYSFIFIYLFLKWCGYVFKLFLDIFGDVSYFFVNVEKILENCFFG